MIELTKQLMRFKTVTGNNKECARLLDFVERLLQHSGAHVKRFEHEGFPSLVASTRLGKHFRYMLVGHIDVVPAEAIMFEPRIESGKLYGRGAIDMKAQCAAMIELLKHNKEASLAVMLTSDEEQGGEHGVKYLLEQGYTCDFFIAPDGGTNFRLITKEKGTLWLEVKMRGNPCHGSMPWLGENAIEKLMDALNLVKGMFHNRDSWVTTLNISKIKGGSTPNAVPAEATATLDIRWIEDGNAWKERICRLFDECRVVQFGNLFRTEPHNPELRRLKSIIEKETGHKAEPSFEHGASDARFFSAKGIPGAIFNPNGGGAHSKHEWLELSSLESFYKVLEEFIH